MKVISTNIAQIRTIEWNGEEVQTGIYKLPVDEPLHLEKTDVRGDHVIDRRYHGGEDKACYLYSWDHYPYWKERYPDLDWTPGMFGENLTVEGLDESTIMIGDIYRLGTAVVQVTQPRQPCFKLGVRFGSQNMVKEFKKSPFPGVYVRVLENGVVKKGDLLQLLERKSNGVSIAEVFHVIYHIPADRELLDRILTDQDLPVSCRENIHRKHQL